MRCSVVHLGSRYRADGGADGLMWWTMRYVAIIWVAQLNFWISKTGLTGWAEVADVPANSLTLIPTFAVSAPTMLPSLETWWLTALGCAIAWLATILVPRHRLPMIYTLRLLMLVRLSALVFFYQWPESIPTTTANFLTDIFRQSAGLVLLIPSLFALTLYLFPAAVVGKDRCDFFCDFVYVLVRAAAGRVRSLGSAKGRHLVYASPFSVFRALATSRRTDGNLQFFSEPASGR